MQKKLFLLLLLPALSAIAVYADFGLGNIKVSGFGNILLYVTRQALMELNNLTAAKTYHMMMLAGCFNFIMMMPFIEMKLINQA